MGFFKYVDNVMAIVSAIAAFAAHRDPSQLARAVARELYKAVDESIDADLTQVVDKRRLVKAVADLVDVFEPLLGCNTEEDEVGDPFADVALS